MFNNNDLLQFAAQGISEKQIETQIENFKQGFPFLNITAAATPQKGITQLSPQQQTAYINLYDQWNGSRIKFVPASGAATRMFKSLYEAMQKLDAKQPINWDDKEMANVMAFFNQLHKFAFYEQLKTLAANKNINLDKLSEKDYSAILHLLLDKDGLNYGSSPKGLLAFHQYFKNNTRTAFEEHLMEAALYGKNKENIAKVHFTVSPEHHKDFEKLYNEKQSGYEKYYNVQYQISFSEQKKSTDTIAVDTNNIPFRNADNSVLFRPAGHGALLENLNDLNADIVFIKNIDNVVPEYYIAETVRWKKIIAGVLLESQKKTFNYLNELENGNVNKDKLDEILAFIKTTYHITPPKNLEPKDLKHYLFTKLNRPIRVCGMVKNEGEPGGGPFIAYDEDGSQSPQIAETQQIDTGNIQQSKIVKSATHFNPVDLVCGIKNYKGEKFDLLKYRDANTGFISIKSKDGKELKAQELPGLWNGAMSNWNTIFVEAPLITFNPVKTINDLLRKEHQ